MVTTKILLTDTLAGRLGALAAANGKTLDEFIQGVLSALDPVPPADLRARYTEAASLVGSIEDPEGRTDLSARHDAYAWDPQP